MPTKDRLEQPRSVVISLPSKKDISVSLAIAIRYTTDTERYLRVLPIPDVLLSARRFSRKARVHGRTFRRSGCSPAGVCVHGVLQLLCGDPGLCDPANRIESHPPRRQRQCARNAWRVGPTLGGRRCFSVRAPLPPPRPAWNTLLSPTVKSTRYEGTIRTLKTYSA